MEMMRARFRRGNEDFRPTRRPFPPQSAKADFPKFQRQVSTCRRSTCRPTTCR